MVTRKRSKSYWPALSKRCWPRILLKRRSRLPLYIALLTIIILQWYINLTQPALTRIKIQQYFSRYKATFSKAQHIQYQLKMLSFKFDFREHVNAIAVRKSSNLMPTSPSRILRNVFTISEQERYQQWAVVTSVRCSLKNFRFFLESFREALIDSKAPVICIFALVCQDATEQWAMTSATMISYFENCPIKFVWNVTESEQKTNFRKRHHSIEELQKPKLQWWYFINRFFQNGIKEGILFNGILKNFKQDVIFVNTDVVLSPDFLQVATYARKMKASLPGITQFSLGTWAGQNLINAHPDTFAVRISRDYHEFVYAINVSNWKTLSDIQQQFLEDLNPVWSEAVGDAMSSVSGGQGIRTIVPTLSRYWLVSPSILNRLPRPSFPPWLFSPLPISENASSLNVGIRDSLGFLCANHDTLNDGPVQNAICYCSFWTYEKTTVRFFPRCFPQANDDCLDSY